MANSDARNERLHDLARILRISGSIGKHKVDNPQALLLVDVRIGLHLLDKRHYNVGDMSPILLPPLCKMVGTVGDVKKCKQIVNASSKDIYKGNALDVASSPNTVMPKILTSDRSEVICSLTGSHPSWSTFLRNCNIWFFFLFCSVQKYSTLSTKLSITVAKCTLVRKKGVFSPLKTKAKPNCTPPIFITAHTPPVHGGV